MYTKITRLVITATAALSLFGGATFAQASTLSATQVSAIIGLLQSFGADSATINQVSQVLGGTTQTQTSCVDLPRTLTLGANSTEVALLQSYLNTKGYLSVNGTGYYGFMTAQAVGKLQLALGIVSSADDPAYGIMGPRTRAAVGCGGGQPTVSGVSVIMTPTSGSAPLKVQFILKRADEVFTAATLVDFGDGQIGQIKSGCPTEGPCQYTEHTYTTAGSYAATAFIPMKGGQPCSSEAGMGCNYDSKQEIGTRVIHVTGNSNTPTATIDQNSVMTPIDSSRTDVRISGGAKNIGGTHANEAAYNYIYIAVVPATYTGTLDMRVMGSINNNIVVGSTNELVQNGRWAHSFNLAKGTYKVLVYDYYGNTATPIVTSTLTVAGGDSNTPTAPKITVISPNGGEVLTRGESFSARLMMSGTFPTGTKLCINFTNQSNQTNYAPLTNTNGEQCVAADVSKNLQEVVISGKLSTSNFLMPTGVYKVRAFLVFAQGSYDRALDVFDMSDGSFTVSDSNSNAPTPTPTIKTLLPTAGSGSVLGNSIPMTWSYENIPAGSQIIASLSTISSTGTNSGVSDGTWQSGAISGSGTLSYAWPADPSKQNGSSTFRLSTKVRKCDPSGCNYHYPINDTYANIAIAPTVDFDANQSNPGNLPLCPATAAAQRGLNGQEFKCMCPPNFTVKQIWGSPVGTGYYTDDSDICTAGAQVGQMNPTTGGQVYYMIGQGQSSYPAYSGHGITSGSWGSWYGSFKITGPKG